MKNKIKYLLLLCFITNSYVVKSQIDSLSIAKLIHLNRFINQYFNASSLSENNQISLNKKVKLYSLFVNNAQIFDDANLIKNKGLVVERYVSLNEYTKELNNTHRYLDAYIRSSNIGTILDTKVEKNDYDIYSLIIEKELFSFPVENSKINYWTCKSNLEVELIMNKNDISNIKIRNIRQLSIPSEWVVHLNTKPSKVKTKKEYYLTPTLPFFKFPDQSTQLYTLNTSQFGLGLNGGIHFKSLLQSTTEKKHAIYYGVGMDFMYYNAHVADLHSFNRWVDKDGDLYYQIASGQDIDIDNYYILFGIPIGYNFEKSLNPEKSYYVKGGINLAFDLVSSINIKGDMNIKGYYPQYNTVISDLPEYGFINETVEYMNNEVRLRLVPKLEAECGLKNRTFGKKYNFSYAIHFSMPIGLSADFIKNEPGENPNLNSMLNHYLDYNAFVLGFRMSFEKNTQSIIPLQVYKINKEQ